MTVLGVAGFAAGLILYFVAKKFNVKEDPRIGEIEEILPGANCGACGRKGCHDFAVECCRASDLDGLSCPGAGSEGMRRIASVLGITPLSAQEKKPTSDAAAQNATGPLTAILRQSAHAAPQKLSPCPPATAHGDASEAATA